MTLYESKKIHSHQHETEMNARRTTIERNEMLLAQEADGTLKKIPQITKNRGQSVNCEEITIDQVITNIEMIKKHHQADMKKSTQTSVRKAIVEMS